MVAEKNLYSIFEIYDIAVKAFRGITDFIKGQKANVMDEKLRERIMLAVTAVNKCPLCSYAHTKMALEAGLTNEEIKSFVSGDFPDIPPHEVKAVLFAQYYADIRGKVDKNTWEELVKEYGFEKAKSILAAIRIIMLGNALGIVFGSIKNRLKGRGDDNRSSLPYEIAFVITFIPFTAIAFLQALLMTLFKAPLIGFSRKSHKSNEDS